MLITKDIGESVKAIHDVCVGLWGTEWDEDFAQTMTDPTARYLAFSQLKPQGGFKEVHLITPDFAKFEYLVRLTYVYEIWRIRKITTPPPRSVDLAKQFSRWFTESEPSTFNTIRTLQHLGSSITYNTMALPKIWWPKAGNFRKMLYLGHPVDMDDFSKAFTQMELDMVKIWEEDVLLGLRLRIEYQQLVDNISNTDVGYSLFSDPRNPCFKGASILLISAICKEPVLSGKFMKGYTHDGQPIWNTLALRKWLISYSKFEELILTKAEYTAGSSSRGTEINCLAWKNTRVRPSRGLFMMGKYLAYLCQYHKGSAISQKDKTIPHAFDAHTSDMIIQDLAIARPFAQFAAYLCFPNDPAIHQLYDCQLFANFGKEFTTTNISTCMKGYTMKFIGKELGVQDWRHISISFRRKLATAIEELISEDGNETIAAAQAHHSRTIENRIYGISAVALATGNADDIFPLFLQHSTDWQDVCGVQRGGNIQPYNMCLAKKNIEPDSAKDTASPMVKEILDLLLPALKTMIQTTVEETVRKIQASLLKLNLNLMLNCIQSTTIPMEHLDQPNKTTQSASSMEHEDHPSTLSTSPMKPQSLIPDRSMTIVPDLTQPSTSFMEHMNQVNIIKKKKKKSV